MKLEHMTEPQLAALMTTLAYSVEGALKELNIEGINGARNQFVILLFDDPRVAQYIGSCERATIVRALRETADRLESRQDLPR